VNRREMLKLGMATACLGQSSNLYSFNKKFSKVRLKKNVVLVTVPLGLFEQNYREGKENNHYFSRFFKDFKDETTYFSNMRQPGFGSAHDAEHATFTGLLYTERDAHLDRPFISLDQHIAEYSLQETRHKSIYHKVAGGGTNCSFNSLAQPAPSFNDISSLHENLFSHVDMLKVKMDIARKQFILKELYNNTKRRWKGSQEEKDMVGSIDYKLDDLESQLKWLKVRKPKMQPKFDANAVNNAPLKHIDENFNTIFNALEKEQTKVAMVQFSGGLLRGLPDISYGHHSLHHHSYRSEYVEQLSSVDSYMMQGLSHFLTKLKDADMLDDTIVLFTCATSDANTHNTKNIPAFLFGGGFKHKKCIECVDENQKLLHPTIKLYSSILKQCGFHDPSFSGNKEVIKELFQEA
jgi:hypothetical protein